MGTEWIIDLRSKETFAAGHIPGSINIPLGPSCAAWAERLIPPQASLVIIYDDQTSLDSIKLSLAHLPNQDIRYLPIPEGKELVTLETLTVEELVKSVIPRFILDVRSEEEWESGHILGAHHIPLQEVEEKMSQIPKNKNIALICGSGYRSAIFASFLQRAGYLRVANVVGGMRAWIEQGLPISEGVSTPHLNPNPPF